MGKENRRKFIEAYPTVSRSAGLCFESAATRGSWRVVVASVAACNQSHQETRGREEEGKRCRRHFCSPSFSAPSSRIFLSSLPRVEPNVNPGHSATPRSGDPVLAGERYMLFMQPNSPQKWLGRGADPICNFRLLPKNGWGEVPACNFQLLPKKDSHLKCVGVLSASQSLFDRPVFQLR